MSRRRPPTHPNVRARRQAPTRPRLAPPIPREEPEPVREPRVLGARLTPVPSRSFEAWRREVCRRLWPGETPSARRFDAAFEDLVPCPEELHAMGETVEEFVRNVTEENV